MPVSEVNITFDTKAYPEYGTIAGAYRVALERNTGQIGIFQLDCTKFDVLDAACVAISYAVDNVAQQLAEKSIYTFNITVHSEYGHGLWEKLLQEKPAAYTALYKKMNVVENTTIRTGLTRPGNNPLRNHTYVSAVQGLTGVTLPVDAAENYPQQWFTMQKVQTECYSPPTALGTPVTDNLRANPMEIQRIKDETPAIWQVIEHALNHKDAQIEAATLS